MTIKNLTDDEQLLLLFILNNKYKKLNWKKNYVYVNIAASFPIKTLLNYNIIHKAFAVTYAYMFKLFSFILIVQKDSESSDLKSLP